MALPGLMIAGSLLALAIGLFYQLAIQPTGNSLTLGPRFFKTLGWTTLQATLSALLSVTLGVALAWALSHQSSFAGRKIYIALLSSALVLPTLVVVLGLVTVLGRSGWLNSGLQVAQLQIIDPFIYGLGGILIAHCYFNISFAARSILHRFESIPAEQLKLAQSLGLNSWQRFKLIELPAVSSSLATLTTTIFLLCFTSFAIVLTLGGTPKYNTLEVSIYEAIKLDFDLGRALGLALAQLTICGVLVIVSSGFRNNTMLISGNQHRRPVNQNRLLTKGIQWTIIIVFGVFFLLPLLAVMIDGITADFSALLGQKTFQMALITSVLIALVSTGIVLVSSIALAIAYTTLAIEQRLGGFKLSRITLRLLSFSSTLYLAVPSLVLGIGFFLLARNIGGDYKLWAIVALLTANTIMVLPFAIAIFAPAMVKSANRYDKLAASLGLRGWHRWRVIESALLQREHIYIACLAFCMSLGDLGVIALFGSNDIATLPWLLYQKMGSYRTQEAAGVALVMLMLTLIVFLAVPKILGRENATAR